MPRILIVEDEAIIRSALKRLLERHDYRVSEAASVEEARELPQRLRSGDQRSAPAVEPGTALIAPPPRPRCSS